MKKILIIFNGIHFPSAVVSYATQVARTDGSMLCGIFINSLRLKESLTYLFPNDLALTQRDYTTESDEAEGRHLVATQIRLFEDECTAAGLPHKVWFYQQTSVQHLVAHSAYADLIIADTITEFNEFPLSQILAGAHCPVHLVKPEGLPLQQVVLTFDGSLNSMHALKQYTYLMPQGQPLPTRLISVKPQDALPSEGEDDLADWLQQHFRQVRTLRLQGEAKDELIDFLQQTPNALVVMGAFGRSALSRWMRQSLADVVLQETTASLFITHL